MAAVITLTTDFGTRDPYVAEMKAVILRLNPDARLVDVTHDVAPHDVLEGALAVEAMVAVCPTGTVHLAVVDPGVGTSRRGLVLSAGGQFFVGPDNGIFTAVLSLPDRRGVRAARSGLPAPNGDGHLPRPRRLRPGGRASDAGCPAGAFRSADR